MLIDRSSGCRARSSCGSIARRLGIDVGDDPQPIALVEHARLLRDVGGRVVQPEIRLEAGARGFGDHLARAVRIEAVDHHPIEAGQRAHLASRHAVERALVVGLLQPRDHAAHVAPALMLGLVHRAARIRSRRRRRDVHGDVAAQPFARCSSIPNARATVSPMTALCRWPRIAWTASTLKTWSSGCPSRLAGVAPQPLRDVARDANDRPVAAIDRDQESERLHRADQVDRLAVAIGEVDGDPGAIRHRLPRPRGR